MPNPNTLHPVKLRDGELTLFIGDAVQHREVMAEGYLGKAWALGLDPWKRSGALSLVSLIACVRKISPLPEGAKWPDYGWEVEREDDAFNARFDALRPLNLGGHEIAQVIRAIQSRAAVSREEEKKPVGG